MSYRVARNMIATDVLHLAVSVQRYEVCVCQEFAQVRALSVLSEPSLGFVQTFVSGGFGVGDGDPDLRVLRTWCVSWDGESEKFGEGWRIRGWSLMRFLIIEFRSSQSHPRA